MKLKTLHSFYKKLFTYVPIEINLLFGFTVRVILNPLMHNVPKWSDTL